MVWNWASGRMLQPAGSCFYFFFFFQISFTLIFSCTNDVDVLVSSEDWLVGVGMRIECRIQNGNPRYEGYEIQMRVQRNRLQKRSDSAGQDVCLPMGQIYYLALVSNGTK